MLLLFLLAYLWSDDVSQTCASKQDAVIHHRTTDISISFTALRIREKLVSVMRLETCYRGDFRRRFSVGVLIYYTLAASTHRWGNARV